MRFRKLLMTYFIVYLLFFLMVLGTMIPLRNRIYALSKERVLTENSLRLERGEKELEKQFAKMTQLSSLMCLNEDFLRLARLKQTEVTVEHAFYLQRVKKQINAYLALMDDLEYCVVFFPNNQLFVSNTMIAANYEEVYGTLFQVGDLSADTFCDYMHADAFSVSCLPASSLVCGSNFYGSDMLTFISHGALNANMTNVGSFAFGIQANNFLTNLFPEVFQDGGFAVIVDQENRWLADHGAAISQEMIADMMENEMIAIGDERYVIFRQENAHTSVRLMIGLPQSLITQNTHILMDFMPLYLSVSLLLSILLCVVYAMWHYHSVKQLMTVGIQLSNVPYRNTSGYRYVREALEQISHTKDQLAQELSLLDNAYMNNMLTNACLYGIYTQQEAETLQKYVGDLPLYRIVIIKFSDSFDSARILQLEFEIQQNLSEYQVIPIRQKPMKSILIIAGEGVLREEATQCLQRLLSQQEECGAGVSDVLSGIEMLRQGYQQAQQALRDQATSGRQEGVFVYQATENHAVLAEIAILKRLNDLVFTGKREGVEAVFGELSEKLAFTAGITDERFRELYYSLQLVLQNIARELGMDLPDNTAKNDCSYQDTLARLREDALLLIDFIEARQQRGNEKLYQAVLEKMQCLLSNPALNAARMAEEMGCSEKYIFKVVKDGSGRSFGELLESMRIRRTETLLGQTDMSNEAIAAEAGFASLSTFYRAFRKAHGVTPAVWRTAQEQRKEISKPE